MRRIINAISMLIYCLCLFTSKIAYAGVQVIGTRVVFDGDTSEASLSIENNDKRPFLVQAWLDDGKDTGGPPKESVIPLFISPPLSRLDGGKQNILRVIALEGIENKLLSDRESVFWISVKEIPEAVLQKPEENLLQIAVRTRIKLFYRPRGLASKYNPHTAYDKIIWSTSPSKEGIITLIAKNSSPYFITFSKIILNTQNEFNEQNQSLSNKNKVSESNNEETIPAGNMIAPFSQISFSLEQTKYAKKGVHHVTYQTINDYGGTTIPVKTNISLAP